MERSLVQIISYAYEHWRWFLCLDLEIIRKVRLAGKLSLDKLKTGETKNTPLAMKLGFAVWKCVEKSGNCKA